jgi:hypothetical protein
MSLLTKPHKQNWLQNSMGDQNFEKIKIGGLKSWFLK